MTISVKQNSQSPLIWSFHCSPLCHLHWKTAAEREGRTREFGLSIQLTARLCTFIADSIHSPDLYFQGSKWYKRQTPEEFNNTCLCLNRTHNMGYAHVCLGHGLVYRLQDNRFLSSSPCEGSSLLKRPLRRQVFRRNRNTFAQVFGGFIGRCVHSKYLEGVHSYISLSEKERECRQLGFSETQMK